MTGDPLWYKDAIIYEVHVRAFSDSDGDGIGDFRGLTEKLDYLEDLGVNTLWLLPFYPSPLKDDGYDISDYTSVHPAYGTLEDFRVFIQEAHRRGLRVITELVVNHTSDRHPWFQRARRARPGDPARDWYVWSETADRFRDARVIFGDFEPSNWTWDPVAQAYYWHRFYAHQPDLNFDHPEVHRAIVEAAEFWLRLGVDGFRLDAIPYLYEREGTSCENLPETHAFLRKLRKHIDQHFPNRVLLAEANQWPEDAVAYFGAGDECNMAFHFPIMTRLFLAVHMEDRYPMVDILSQTPALPEAAQWALFLRNHDELTLEMVTDHERDYMYRVYAQERAARINLGIRRRLAPLLQNNRKKIELLNALLFSLPGTPVIYYGDEIGMGDNIFLGDRNSVRTPMQWSGDRNAGFSRANAQQLYLPVVVEPEYHFEAVNVEAQKANSQSLLWWMKRLLALSRRFRAFGRGTFELLTPENRKVLAYVRRHQDEVLLVVANLSRFAQSVELDLRPVKGRIPVEMFGRTPFPKVGDSAYFLTLGPHAFYWFSLEKPQETTSIPKVEEPIPLLDPGTWKDLRNGRPRPALERALQTWLLRTQALADRSRSVRSFRITESFGLSLDGVDAVLALAQVEFLEGEGETYSIPLLLKAESAAEEAYELPGPDLVAEVKGPQGRARIVDAMSEESFRRAWTAMMSADSPLRVPGGRVSAVRSCAVPAADLVAGGRPGSEGRFHLKWYRAVQEGVHPEIEVSQFLAERAAEAPIPACAGHWEYARRSREPLTLALLQENVQEKQDAWPQAADALGRYFEAVRSMPSLPPSFPSGPARLSQLLSGDPAPEVVAVVGPYLESVRKMGECTARLHLLLSRDPHHPAFAPELLPASKRQNIYQALRRKIALTFAALRQASRSEGSPLAQHLLAQESLLQKSCPVLLRMVLGSVQIRCHGDLRLQNLISTGDDFVVTNLPGPAAGPFIERRIKRSPWWDVGSMLRSFHEAAYTALADQESGGEVAADRWPGLERAAAAWYGGVFRTYVTAYQGSMAAAPFDLGKPLPSLLLSMLERAVDDVGTAVAVRPESLQAVLRGLEELLEDLRTLV